MATWNSNDHLFVEAVSALAVRPGRRIPVAAAVTRENLVSGGDRALDFRASRRAETVIAGKLAVRADEHSRAGDNSSDHSDQRSDG